ncbi:MAG: hypothetical protein F6K19_17175 [Cyanothece sp. SIO1E1]|nr:hypothetical protein [Cyanothece sp. SIO1E1]
MAPKLEEIRQFWHSAQEMGALPIDYQSWSAHQKQEFLWTERILKSEYHQLPPLEKIDVVGLFLTHLSTKMDLDSDESPKRWKKAIHAHGSVAKIKFISAPESPFTGLLKGADYGLLRLSVTADPADRGFAPGLALKLFVDGHASENFSALVSLTGQGDNYNLLANEFSNIVPVVPQFGPKLINWIFKRVTRFPTKLYLQELGQIDQHGKREATPYYPNQIFLVPNPQIQFPASPPHDFRKDLVQIGANTLLFSVYAVDPKQLKGDSTDAPNPIEYRQHAQLIGQIQTTSEFVASFYGDSQLFFRHQRFKNK